ncbi:MAG TPA: DUF1467 family protein [Sphingobium sp.]|nr:DUF1467 family protein [Sphingobium sp.]
MRWTTILAIYFLLWFLSLFLVLPFGVKTAEEAGKELVPGQAESAPHEFRPLRTFGATSLVAAVLFLLFYANYVNGWIDADTFKGLYNPPVDLSQ